MPFKTFISTEFYFKTFMKSIFDWGNVLNEVDVSRVLLFCKLMCQETVGILWKLLQNLKSFLFYFVFFGNCCNCHTFVFLWTVENVNFITLSERFCLSKLFVCCYFSFQQKDFTWNKELNLVGDIFFYLWSAPVPNICMSLIHFLRDSQHYSIVLQCECPEFQCEW